MRVLSIEAKPFAQLLYSNAGPRGKTETARLQWFRAKVDRLPEGCDALVCTSDLQGYVAAPWQSAKLGVAQRLLGEGVAEQMDELSEARELPALGRVGVILAGDFYAIPGSQKRGGFGPVQSVYRAFADRAKWVIAVAGNHDDVSGGPAGVDLLDGETVAAGGLRIGGVGCVIGSSDKPGKRSETDQSTLLDLVLEDGPAVVVLHEGPSHTREFHGRDEIRDKLIQAKIPLTIFGHTAWHEPFVHLAARVAALNVHERVVVLTT